MPALGASVAADRDQQRRGTPAQRLVRQPPGHRVPRRAFAPAAPAPAIRLDDPAGKHRTIGLQPLTHDVEAEFVKAAESGQVRASEGSVKHVEVFRVGGVRTSIIGRPRPLPVDRRADSYTLICDEPDKGSALHLHLWRDHRRTTTAIGAAAVRNSQRPGHAG